MPKYEFYWERVRDLRNGFAHHFSPNPGIILTQKANLQGRELGHLLRCNGKIVFVIEEFYNDFAIACGQIIKMIKSNQLQKNSKVYKDILNTNLPDKCSY